jgi:hypothetical protein
MTRQANRHRKEFKTMASEQISLPDDLMAQYFPSASTEAATPAQAETKEVPAAEAAPAITPPVVEKPTESGVTPKVAEVASVDGGKPLYTPEEVAQILKEEATTGKVILDSSRLTPEGRLLQKSFQQGYGPKFEQAAKMKAEAEKIRADIEREKREAANQKLFDKEAEEFGPEEAQRNLRERQRDEKIAMLEYENQQVRQREAGTQILNEYSKVSPKFHIPQDDDFTNMILGSIVGNDFRGINGYPKTIEESTAMFADKLGFTNVENLWKIIRANPDNETAVKNFYINQHIKDKAKGPTVSASSSANVQTEIKPTPGAKKSIMDIAMEHFGVPAGEEIILK